MTFTEQEQKIWKIVKSYFDERGLISHQIESFNHLVTKYIPKIFENESDIIVTPQKDHKYIVSFKESYIDKPSIIEEDRTIHPITPNEARIRDLTYEALISVDISTELWKEDGDKKELLESKYFEKISIARLPIMIRSCKCNLDEMNSRDLIESRECSYDSGGYFIIKGKERVIVAQERINYNQVYVFKQKSINKYAYIAEIRSTSERTGHSVLIQAKIGDDGRNICFSLPYIQQDIPAGIVFHAMGFSDIESLVLPCYKNEGDEKILKIKELINRIVREGWHIQDRNKALEYVGQYAMHTINKERRIQYSQQILENELLPHLGISSSIHERALFLGFMIRKLITTYLGFRPEDDRDNVNNKRLETVGTLVGNLFKSLFKRFIKSLQQFLVKKPDIMIAIPRFNTITYKLRHNFSTGNWGLKKSSYIRTGVSQVLSRLSFGSTLSHLRRIAIPIGKEGKNTKIRQTHPSQFGFVCPVETPEGHSAGIVKNLALLSSVTIDVPKINVQEIVEDGPGFLSLLNGYKKATTKVIMDGIWLGVCKDHNVLLNYLKDMRERKLLHDTVGISYDKIDDELFVFTDAGRLFRPLFVVENDTIPALEQKTWDWDHLVEEGYIKYVDSLEVEESVIAMWPQNLGKKVKYNYCEIHPSMLLGVCGSTIPFPDHSQSPRNCYQASMGKQALGIYALSHSMRVDTITHTLHYPQKPLVSTIPGDFMGFSDMPSGINAIVAIACYSGFNQEDSVIMNKSAIERGLFRTTAYRTLLIQEQKRGSHSFEAIELPPNDIRNNSHNYRKLGRDGIIEPGVPVRKGDILVGKVISKMSKSGDEEKKECSRVATIGEEGMVEKVFLTTNTDGYKLVRIKIRSVRIPEIGDKFACFSPDTEVLTDEGWIFINKLTTDMNVACLVDEKKLEYHQPTELQSYDYQGNMYCVESCKVSLKVTPNHRMYTGNCNRKTYKILRADKIYGKIRSYKNNVEEWEPEKKKKVFILPSSHGLPELELDLEAWCLFFGIWIAEGSCTICYYSETNSIRSRHVAIAANKKRVRHQLNICMKKIEIKWNYHLSRGEKNRWSSCDLRLIYYLKPLSLGAINKFLPKWCFELDQYHSRKLIEGMILGDGCYMKGTTTQRYYTASIRLRDDFQRLCLHAGWGCNYYLKSPKGTKSMCLGKEITSNADYWSLTICKTQTKPLINKYIKQGKQQDYWEKYDGKVYCCTVPTKDGLIYIRRNGKGIWCGQSRSAQKGVCGMVYRQEDLPFSRDGICPDILINPHAIPSRMTINQLMECVIGKASVLKGKFADSTPFTSSSKMETIEKICEGLKEFGFEDNGYETLYSGFTGEPIKAKIFIGPTYYQRLKHLVKDKIHSRSFGNVQMLTLQPVAGRSKQGGLRFGEMERDAMISHGTASFLRERLFDMSDPYQVRVCPQCGIMVNSMNKCDTCGEDNIVWVELPYAMKLLFQELQAMGIKTKLIPGA